MSELNSQSIDLSRPFLHACEIEVIFPTNEQAEQAIQILQVDREPTERVSKVFHLVNEEATNDRSGRVTNDVDQNVKSDNDGVIYRRMKV